MKALVLTFFEGDREVIKGYVESLREMTPEKLVEAYNRELKIGITGVRRQGLWLYSMQKVFLERFGESPIILDKSIIELTDPIEIVDGKVSYLKENPYKMKEIADPPSEEELMACTSVKFTSQPVIYFVFFCLVIRMDSIAELWGDTIGFIGKHFHHGVMNKDLLTMNSMSCPGPEIGRIVEEALFPAGFRQNIDYAVLQDDCPPSHDENTSHQVFLPNSSCRDIPWLGSVVTDAGNFIWFR